MPKEDVLQKTKLTTYNLKPRSDQNSQFVRQNYKPPKYSIGTSAGVLHCE